MKKIITLSAAALMMASAIGAQADTFPRKALLEHFTTILCGNCPAGNATLLASTKDRDVVWVAHHVGYYTDELTAADSKEMLNFGINAAPMAMLDRTVWDGGKLPFGIGYPNANQGAKVVGNYIDQALAVPANVGIFIRHSYNEETRELALDIDLERNSDLPDNALLTVQLVENGVHADKGQAGANSVHRHNHVYRKSLTDIMGATINWKDGGNIATMSYTTVIPEEWDATRLQAAAFVNPPRNVNNVNANAVYNAEITDYLQKVDEATGNPVFTPEPGDYTGMQTISIEADKDAQIYYTVDGSDPDETSDLFTVPFMIRTTTTIKARAYAKGYNPSEIVTAVYNITNNVGIDTVDTDASTTGTAEWFDLQGRPVNPASLPAGIYIKRVGTEVSRVAVK